MKITKLAVLLALSVGVSACTSANRFDNEGTGAGTGAAADAVNVAPKPVDPASDPRTVAYFQQTIGDRVLFEVDQSTLTDQARSILAQQATWLSANQDYRAIVEGHADEQGTRAYNLALGNRRANAASEYLISQGVAADRLQTVTFGKERPLEVCSDEACYSKNRRAVTILKAGAGS